jgi:putative membrane protein
MRMKTQPQHPARPFRLAAAAAAVSALALAMPPAWAQASGGTGTGTSGGSTGSTSSGPSGASGSASGGASSAKSGSGSAGDKAGGSLAREDSRMMSDLAHANIAEIETGKMALEKSQNEQVKKFAQQMIDDHGSALKELQTLAQSKGMTLPDSTDIQHKTISTALKVLSGDTFDKQYVTRVGVNDHQRTLTLLQKAQKGAKDPDVKALATKMVPTVQHHLTMARQMASQMDKNKGNASSGSSSGGGRTSSGGGAGSRSSAAGGSSSGSSSGSGGSSGGAKQ